EQPAARCALARLAAEWGLEDAAPSLVAAYARPAGPGSLEEVRAAVVEAVQALGGAGVAAAAAELAACEPGDPAGAWVLDLLVSLEPKRHGGTLTRLFERLGPSHQAGLSDWLATLLTRSPNALFDLLAGTLSRAPVDPRLARRVQAACGAERLERQATKLAANGHGGARVVLRNLYGY
ncbi:MAG: hypothetical protein HYU66_14245, partial [Armatimonadetes bacterium]|nr:hypothetical protein [Armatimonadota bacterium]